MIVSVRLFARAKELMNAGSLEVDLPEGSSLGMVRQQLARQYPAAEGLLSRCALAVDEEFADDGMILRPGATVAVLPPVSGG